MAGATTVSNIVKKVIPSIAPAASNTELPKVDPPVSGSPPFPNVLNDYQLFNYIFTLSVLSNEQINSNSYRNQPLNSSAIILRSASGFPDNRVSTAYTTADNPEGKFDFFMDDVRISSVIGFNKSSGNTNAIGISFRVTEPYSMGLFFQSLQIAARNNGNKNYLDVPLLLTIEFLGHKSPDEQRIKVPNTTKYIPMRIRSLDMSVNTAGAVYNVEAYPWSEKAFSTIHAELKTDAALSGKTVGELLIDNVKSLRNLLNERAIKEYERRSDLTEPPDLISIDFPETSDQETGNNAIYHSKMGFTNTRTGTQPFTRENSAYDAASGTFKRGKVTIDPETTEFKFSQGLDVVSVINQVVLMSEYGQQALKNVDSDGMVKWWRIEPRVYQNSQNPNSTGSHSKYVVYRVIPYKVHSSKLSAPGTTLKGKENLRRQALKHYNYIYTGKNIDILDFDIEFKAGFYTSLNADSGLNSGDTRIGAQQSNSVTTDSGVATAPIQAEKNVDTITPDIAVNDKIKTGLAHRGGGGLEDYKTLAARQFHDAVTSGVDMIQLEIKILGDPYYISDSGMGNYSAKCTKLSNMNSDGCMDYQSGEVDILIDFRVPIDNSMATGKYDFPKGTKLLESFSGLYQVLRVESNFAKGMFTQTLKLVRRKNQESSNREGQPVVAESPTQQNFKPN
jgi:hypothetical protein